MKLTETPPEGLVDWIKKQKLDWRDYLVYRSGWEADQTGRKHRCVDATCTHCGASFQTEKVPKELFRYSRSPYGLRSPASGDPITNGDVLLCPGCGAEITAAHLSRVDELTRCVWPMTAEAQEGKLLLYLWRVKREIRKDGGTALNTEPWECYIFSAKDAEKWTHWRKVQNRTQLTARWEKKSQMKDTMLDIELVYCPEGLANIYAATECANCKLETYMEIKDDYRFPVVWMRTWQRHRAAEMLMSPNTKRLTAALIAHRKRQTASWREKWSRNTDVLRGLNWKGRRSHGVLRLEKEELNYFADKPDAAAQYDALLLARKHGVPCRCGEEDTTMSTGTQERILKRGVLPGKATRYIRKQRARRKTGIWENLLCDYWDMAEALGEDLHDRDTLWPQDLRAAHDRCVERKKAEAAEHRKKSFQQRYERMKKYAFEADGIFIRPCETEEELIREGKALHHCVASYAARHAKGDLTIFFIRLNAAPDESWYTLNFDEKRLSVTENRGLRNCKRTDEVREFENKWLEWIHSGRKRRKDAV